MNEESFNDLLGSCHSQIHFSDIEASKCILKEYGYEVQNIIGIGYFGGVVEATSSKCQQVAIKVISCKTDKEIMNCFKEASLMRKAYSSNVAKLEEYFVDFESKNVFLVFQVYKGGNLESYMEKNKNMSEREIKDLFTGILKGVQALHDKNIIHSDIKPENVLMSEDGNPFISDFGLSNFIKKDNFDASLIGTNDMYSSPEVSQTQRVTFDSDYFSLGMILLFLSGNMKYSEILKIKLNGQPNFSNCKNQNLVKLALTMMSFEPKERQNIKNMIQIINGEQNNLKSRKPKSEDLKEVKNPNQQTLQIKRRDKEENIQNQRRREYNFEALNNQNFSFPNWKTLRNGLNVEGKCTNNECQAFEELVISMKGFGQFNITENLDKIGCPMCKKNIQPVECIFTNCQYLWDGVKILNEKNINFKSLVDSQEAQGEYSYLTIQYQNEGINKQEWSKLVIESKQINEYRKPKPAQENCFQCKIDNLCYFHWKQNLVTNL